MKIHLGHGAILAPRRQTFINGLLLVAKLQNLTNRFADSARQPVTAMRANVVRRVAFGDHLRYRRHLA